MLLKTKKYNDITPELENEIMERVNSFGDFVRYRFNIERENPDPEKHDGKYIFPNTWTLDPTEWTITDKYEKRAGYSKSKRIAIVTELNDKGEASRFGKIRVKATMAGLYDLNLTKDEDKIQCIALELHPKNGNGMFPDKNLIPMFNRVDEGAEAEAKMKERSARKTAMDYAENMSDEDVKNFADAMQWDSTRNPKVLRNEIGEMAETEPVFFNEFVNSNTTAFLTLVKKALDKRVISFDPAENKYTWAGSNQIITLVTCEPGKQNEKFAEWLQAGGKQAEDAHNKIKSMVGGKKEKAVA